MAKSTEKKEDKPRYETPVVVRLDKMDKASGAEGDATCTPGSSADSCTGGGGPVFGCGVGVGPLPPPPG